MKHAALITVGAAAGLYLVASAVMGQGGACCEACACDETTTPPADEWAPWSDAVGITDPRENEFWAPSPQSIDDVTMDKNLAAFLVLIRTGEGTADQAGYRRLFGGQLFSGFADHPRQYIRAKIGGVWVTSSAAGAYQILARTWDDVRRVVPLPDFSPASQDAAALALIKRRRALDDIQSGRLWRAVEKCSKEWASLPGSPYGQPTLTTDRAQRVYLAAGGLIDGGSYA